MSAGRRGRTVICKCRKAEQLPGSGWGQGWRRERENGGGWGAVVSFVPTLSPSETQPPVIIPGTPEWPVSLPCFMGEGK